MKHQFCVFSKHFSWLPVPDLARAVRDAGFDGIDLAVRPGGHVEPAEVETALPKAVEAIQAAGLACATIVSGITDPDAPETEPVIRTAADCGVRYYRFGYFSYGESVEDSLLRHATTLRKLAALNERYGIHGAYQNHAGSRVGGPVWDIWEMERQLDPRWIGCQYDVRHAVIEGGTSWELGMRLLSDRIRCIALKDGKWHEPEPGRFTPVSVPLGEGMVDWHRFVELLGETAFEGAVSIHYEYPLFTDDGGELSDAQRTEKTVAAMGPDLETARRLLSGALH